MVFQKDNLMKNLYAQNASTKREDVPEAALWWISVRCKPDTISKSNYEKILKTTPNQIKYLDE